VGRAPSEATLSDDRRLALAAEAARLLAIEGEPVSIEPFGEGHINASYVLATEWGGARARYFLQRINAFVFKDPEALMDNVRRVTEHLRAKLAAEGAPEPGRRALALVPARDGRPFARDSEGGWWRAYRFIEGAVSGGGLVAGRLAGGGSAANREAAAADREAAARVLGAAVGRFQRLLADLPGPRLAETIPRFHDARSRWAAFERAIAEDRAGRAASVGPEIDFFRARREGLDRIVAALESGAVPERITHNDAKADNLLVDRRTGEVLCLVDLDTVMPGAAAYDFGDLARTVPASAAEDERDPRLVGFDLGAYEALAGGYAEGTGAREGRGGSFLTQAERELLPWGARIVTTVQGIRFLSDYLEGDVYYRVERPDHNLRRTRAQMALVAAMEREWDAMRAAAEAAFEL